MDVWLDTGHNRDGSVTVCKTPVGPSSTPLSMFSYDVSIQASGGTVSWSSYTNRVPQMSPVFIGQTDETRFYTGGFTMPLGLSLPPGLYHLGTLTVNVLSGAP